MAAKYTLEEIKFGTDQGTFEKALALYEKGKVTHFKENIRGFSSIVIGTHPYEVDVSVTSYDRGSCNCYLGQTDVLCKHMVAVAIRAVTGGKAVLEKEKMLQYSPIANSKQGELTKEQVAEVKKSMSAAVKYIKAYTVPSKLWFAYQNSLSEGCTRLSSIISDLPVSRQTAKLLLDLLLRLDKKLCSGGVDDSEGEVGGFIQESVQVLIAYTEIDPLIIDVFKVLKGKETCFSWEEPLRKLPDLSLARKRR